MAILRNDSAENIKANALKDGNTPIDVAKAREVLEEFVSAHEGWKVTITTNVDGRQKAGEYDIALDTFDFCVGIARKKGYAYGVVSAVAEKSGEFSERLNGYIAIK